MWTAVTHDSEEDLVDAFRRAAQAWERILFSTGGLLALHKCYWWLLAWDWKDGLPQSREVTKDNHKVKVSNGNDPTLVSIQRLGLHQTNVGLGYRLAPDGNQSEEINHRKSLSDSIAARLNNITLTRSEAWVFYNAIYSPKVYYTASLTSFREHDRENITRAGTAAVLSKMGFNRHISRKVAFGPRKYGGIGLIHGYSKQGSEGVLRLISHVRSGTVVGKLILNVLSQLQLLSGQLENLLANPRPLPARKQRKKSNVYRWHHLGCGWLLQLRHFLWKINASLVLADAWKIRKQREGDVALMDAINAKCDLSEHKLALINSVRLYLKVQVLSDITTMDGRKIEFWARECTTPRESNLNWPTQAEPSKEAVRLWRQVLVKTFALRTNERWKMSEPLMLASPLGQWICLSHVQYKFYWTAQNLYIRRTDGRFDRHRNFRIFTRLFSRNSNISHLPETASPTTATVHSKFILVPDGTRGINGRDAKNDQSQTGALVSAYEQRILGDHPGKEKWSQIYQQLKNGKLVAATDGSYDQHTMTAAGSWVLATKTGRNGNTALAQLMETGRHWTHIGRNWRRFGPSCTSSELSDDIIQPRQRKYH